MPRPDSAKRKLALAKVVSATSARGGTSAVLKDVRELILAARQTVAQSINSALVLLYWQIGVRIRREVLREKRAGYGERIVDALSRQLTVEFGRRFSERLPANIVRFALVFPDQSILHAVCATLSWSPNERRY